jgi:hypothetical protein
MARPTIAEVIDSVIGSEFEIPCKEIRLILRTGEPGGEEIVFRGPGHLHGKSGGEIHYEILDARERGGIDKRVIDRWLGSGSNAFVIEADTFSGIEWLGYYHVPSAEWGEGGGAVVRGQVTQLTTDLEELRERRGPITTVLHYDSILALPPVAPGIDPAEIKFRTGSIIFDSSSGHTIARVSETDIEGAPGEAWLDEALAFALGRYVRHRVALRLVEGRTMVFVRYSSIQDQSGMPRIVSFPAQSGEFWRIFACYLEHSANAGRFAPTSALSTLWAEVLFASTGTVHSFVFALVAAIESVTRAIMDARRSKEEPHPDIQRLRNYVTEWPGNADIKERALALLSQIPNASTGRQLAELAKEGLFTGDQLAVWKDLRNRLAHGHVLDYFHEDVVKWRNTLVDLLHCLVLRYIGYRGNYFSHENGKAVACSWTSLNLAQKSTSEGA